MCYLLRPQWDGRWHSSRAIRPRKRAAPSETRILLFPQQRRYLVLLPQTKRFYCIVPCTSAPFRFIASSNVLSKNRCTFPLHSNGSDRVRHSLFNSGFKARDSLRCQFTDVKVERKLPGLRQLVKLQNHATPMPPEVGQCSVARGIALHCVRLHLSSVSRNAYKQ